MPRTGVLSPALKEAETRSTHRGRPRRPHRQSDRPCRPRRPDLLCTGLRTLARYAQEARRAAAHGGVPRAPRGRAEQARRGPGNSCNSPGADSGRSLSAGRRTTAADTTAGAHAHPDPTAGHGHGSGSAAVDPAAAARGVASTADATASGGAAPRAATRSGRSGVRLGEHAGRTRRGLDGRHHAGHRGRIFRQVEHRPGLLLARDPHRHDVAGRHGRTGMGRTEAARGLPHHRQRRVGRRCGHALPGVLRRAQPVSALRAYRHLRGDDARHGRGRGDRGTARRALHRRHRSCRRSRHASAALDRRRSSARLLLVSRGPRGGLPPRGRAPAVVSHHDAVAGRHRAAATRLV